MGLTSQKALQGKCEWALSDEERLQSIQMVCDDDEAAEGWIQGDPHGTRFHSGSKYRAQILEGENDRTSSPIEQDVTVFKVIGEDVEDRFPNEVIGPTVVVGRQDLKKIASRTKATHELLLRCDQIAAATFSSTQVRAALQEKDEEALNQRCSVSRVAFLKTVIAEKEQQQESIIDVIKQFAGYYNPRPAGQTYPTIIETSLLRAHANASVLAFREMIKTKFPDRPGWAHHPSTRGTLNTSLEYQTTSPDEEKENANTSMEDCEHQIPSCDICGAERYTFPCRGCGMRFCFDCEAAGYRIGRGCMCRGGNELTEREVQNRNMERIRGNDDQDNVVLEESDFNATSSLALARQIMTWLRNQPLSRLLTYFESISSAGKDYQRDFEIQKEYEDRENVRYGKIQSIIEGRFKDWVSKMEKAPMACKDAILLGAKDQDCRIGLYVRATELADAAALAKTSPEERKFISTATYPNRRKDKEDIEKFKGFNEEGSKDIDIHTSPSKDYKTTRICRGYRRVVYVDHGLYLELYKDDIEWDQFRLVRKPSHSYYDLAYTSGGNAKLYLQKRGVKHKPNPPSDGRIRIVRNHCREGYADYQQGLVYIDACSVVLMMSPIARNNEAKYVKRRFSRQSKRMPYQNSNSCCLNKIC